jgi:carbamoyl-phosphate synthase large subunit
MKRPLVIAVTGLNATDNPAPGVPVIRSIRAAAPDSVIVGLAYDPLDPGAYMDRIADHVYLMPYPSHGAEVTLERLREIHADTPIDVLIPTLDAELPAYLKLAARLHEVGIHTLLPDEESLRLRNKEHFGRLRGELGLSVPKSVAISEATEIPKLDQDFDFPVMVKGQFYDAYVAYSPMEVHGHFERIRAKWGAPVIIQEFIPGEEFDVVCLGDGEGGLIGSVAMRKMQLTDKGKAWGGVTISDKRLDAFVREAMEKIAWRGPCEMEVMKAHDGGELYLIEINPRFPAWCYLTVGCDRNLPWATVQLALGLEVAPMPPAPSGVMFLRHSMDQICTMADYAALTTAGELHREV